MNKVLKILPLALIAASVSFRAAAQEPEPPDIEAIAEQEADRLQSLLELDGGQVFYVDSTLKHDYRAMDDEMKALRESKVSNTSIYIAVQDKWMEAIDQSFRKIFTPDQWDEYLKGGAAKQQKARDKRRAKAEAAEARLRKAFE